MISDQEIKDVASLMGVSLLTEPHYVYKNEFIRYYIENKDKLYIDYIDRRMPYIVIFNKEGNPDIIFDFINGKANKVLIRGRRNNYVVATISTKLARSFIRVINNRGSKTDIIRIDEYIKRNTRYSMGIINDIQMKLK